MEKLVKSKQRVDEHGEVFTARREVEAMCDLVAGECRRVDARFLEPACGEGNFLVEILSRKLETAQNSIQALSALASLYGVDILPDNVTRCRHRLWERLKAAFPDTPEADAQRILNTNILCGNALSGKRVDTGENIPFLNGGTTFDVIISNPPYQQKVNEPGRGLGAVPIYQNFVELAKRLRPRYICMIIPARWFSGGVGLGKFRREMLSDRTIRRIVDYTESKDCFPGVDINGGICYFLMDASYNGDCEYTNITGGKSGTAMRRLDEFDVFVRRNEAVSVIHKVLDRGETCLSAPGGCSPQTPYGFLSTYVGAPARTAPTDCALLSSRGWSYVPEAAVTKARETVPLYKPMISKLSCEHAGNPGKNGMYRVLSRMELLNPGEICSQSYLTVCPQPTRQQAENVCRYLRTRFARYLILQTMVGMNLSIRNFQFVPWLDFSITWTDEMLYNRYGLTEAEITAIEALVREM